MIQPPAEQISSWGASPSQWLEYPVMFDPASAQHQWRSARTNRRHRMISLLMSLGIVIAVFFIFREHFSEVYWWFAGVSLLLPLGQLVWALVCEAGARSEASAVTDGMALGLGRDGIWISGSYLAWTQVGGLSVRPARRGRGASLMLTDDQGKPWRLPIEHLAIGPGTLDSAVRALSGGRVWIDFSALDV